MLLLVMITGGGLEGGIVEVVEEEGTAIDGGLRGLWVLGSIPWLISFLLRWVFQ